MGPRKAKPERRRRAGPDAGPDVELVDELERTGSFRADDGAGPDAGPVEHVAPAGDGIAVEVDRTQILEEAAAIAASSSSAAPTPAGELAPAMAGDVEAKAAEVAPAVRMLVAQCAGAFAPNWEITQGEADGVADAAALVMAYWMPDGAIDPKYLAIVTLATALYGVAGKRRRADGSWVPLRAPRAPASTAPAPSPASSSEPAGAVPLRLQ
jgi:hypothetical protein